MLRHPDEFYYEEQYWHWIKYWLELEKIDPKGKFVDLGCGQGRLTFKWAEWADLGNITGCDFSASAIASSQVEAQKRNLNNINFVEDDLEKWIKRSKNDSFAAVMFTEVAFVLPEYRNVLKEMYRTLIIGGLAFVSFRSQYFNLLHTVKGHLWKSAELCSQKTEGDLFFNGMSFTWHSSQEVAQEMQAVGFEVLGIYGIGILSGIEGDPLAMIAQPSKLNEEHQQKLMNLEIALSEKYADCGRYILCVGKKA